MNVVSVEMGHGATHATCRDCDWFSADMDPKHHRLHMRRARRHTETTGHETIIETIRVRAFVPKPGAAS